MENLVEKISVIVPVHNEEQILKNETVKIVNEIRSFNYPFELLLVENGSTDKSLTICKELESIIQEVRAESLQMADYGNALKYGILNSVNDIIIIFNIEFWDIEFIRIALAALNSKDIIIGSKQAPGAFDERPFLRKIITYSYNLILKILWGFKGSDTHGMKAFNKNKVISIVENCVTTGWIFDTEFVLRSQKAGLKKLELPTDVRELRAPSLGSLFNRIPSVIKNLFILFKSL